MKRRRASKLIFLELFQARKVKLNFRFIGFLTDIGQCTYGCGNLLISEAIMRTIIAGLLTTYITDKSRLISYQKQDFAFAVE